MTSKEVVIATLPQAEATVINIGTRMTTRMISNSEEVEEIHTISSSSMEKMACGTMISLPKSSNLAE